MWCTKCASDSHVKAQLRLRDHHSFFLRCFRVQVKKKQYVRRLLVKVKKKKTEKANLRREKKKKKKTHTQGEQEEKKKMLNKAVTTVQSVATYSVSGIEHGGDYVSLNTTRVEATKRRTEKKKGLTSKSTPLFEQNRSSVRRCFFFCCCCCCVCVLLLLSRAVVTAALPQRGMERRRTRGKHSNKKTYVTRRHLKSLSVTTPTVKKKNSLAVA